MNIRERTEALEEENLSIYASLSNNTRGRKIEEAKCNLRTEYQRDRDRILHSKSFRRLKHKTQVFIAPEGDHYRTRLTHTLEVAQIARTVARALRLNEDLVEAIALGHDLGHTPFGHTGERVLNRLNPRGFKHNLQSLRIIDFLERRGNHKTLNLTEEVREGIMQHSGLNKSRTLEGQVVAIADRIAYINHDIDDAIRAGIIGLEDLPKDPIDILGRDHGIRIDRMIEDLVINSMDSHKIEMSQDIGDKVEELREFMFDNVYLDSRAKSEEAKAEYIIEELYNYYLENEGELPSEYYKAYKEDQENLEDIICDYIAGMTDRYVLAVFSDIFLPKAWNKKD